jgi:predicted RNA-binding Zn ribbon-like protein
MRPTGRLFTFSSGRLCLDFLATLVDWRAERATELLTEPARLDDWLQLADLPVPVAGSADSDLADGRSLRSAVNSVARALITAAEPPAADVRVINAFARAATPVYYLRADGRSRVAVAEPTATASLAVIARDAVHLLAGPELNRLRECACTDCATLFFDRSPSGRRRWCSMRGCGERVASASYRRRRNLAPRRPTTRPAAQ